MLDSVSSGGATRRGEAAALAALGLLVVALNVTPITNNDLFLHLTTGRVILETGAVPRVDDYSALARGRPYVAHEWLAAVIFRLTERAFGAHGLDAIILLKTALALLVAACLYAAARALGAAPAAGVVALAPVMTLAAARFIERPHIFTYLMTAVFLLLLARRRSGRRMPLAWLVPLQVLWANLHGAFLMGPVLVVLAAAGEGLDALLLGLPPAAVRPDLERRERLREARRLLFLLPALGAACLVNPYGARLLRFPFELTGSAFMGRIYEWLPPFESRFAATTMARIYVAWALLGAGTFAAALIVARRRRLAPPFGAFQCLLFAALLALSLRMNRGVTDFALGTVPGVAAAATWIASRRSAGATRRSALLWIAAGLAAMAGWFCVAGYSYAPGSRRHAGVGLGRNIPVDAADYLERNAVTGNAFNTYAAGGYLVYRFHPDVRVGMDSRNDVYGEALFDDYLQALMEPQALRGMLERLDASFILLEWPHEGMARAAAVIRQVGGWRPVHIDDVAVVYLREGGRFADLVRRDGYRVLDPALFRPGLLGPGEAAEALREAESAVRRQPRSYTARVMRIDALAALGRYAEALEAERLVLTERPPLHFIYTYLGLLRLGLGHRPEAADRFRLALHHAPRSEAARLGLAQATAGPP